MPEIYDKFDFDHVRIKENLVASYLKSGSVNAILNQFPEVPEPTAHRWLDSYDIVKLGGRKPTPIGPVLYFLNSWAAAGIVPLEYWYRHHLPLSLKETLSIPSLHRIVAYIRSLTTRLSATSLIISPQGEPDKVLVGNDITSPNKSVGKNYGALTIPMTYSKSGESPEQSIKRVLQQEAFSDLTLKKQFPDFIIPKNPSPFMHVAVADVNVAVYHLELPLALIDKLTTQKLENLNFIPLNELVNSDPLDPSIRSGIVEMATGHHTHIEGYPEPLTWSLSRLNEKIVLARA